MICLIISGCNKDKFTTVPQLKYKSISTNVLDKGQLLKITLSFTDQEGDEDLLFIKKVTPYCNKTIFKDSINISADFIATKGKSGDILVTMGYRVSNTLDVGDPKCGVNDTCTFRFVLRDKAKNISDSVDTEPIIIIY